MKRPKLKDNTLYPPTGGIPLQDVYADHNTQSRSDLPTGDAFPLPENMTESISILEKSVSRLYEQVNRSLILLDLASPGIQACPQLPPRHSRIEGAQAALFLLAFEINALDQHLDNVNDALEKLC